MNDYENLYKEYNDILVLINQLEAELGIARRDQTASEKCLDLEAQIDNNKVTLKEAEEKLRTVNPFTGEKEKPPGHESINTNKSK